MSVAAVMLVKDEADIIGYTIRHLFSQVDMVYVADNLSTDGTSGILAALQARYGGRLDLSVDDDPGYRQAAKTTALAMRALQDGHEWVIPCDADEWWYSPHGRRISSVLTDLPATTHFSHAVMHNHISSSRDPQTDANPFTRIGWRFREAGAMTKVACRLSPDLWIEMGNHAATKEGSIRSDWHHTMYDQVYVRHFPWRSEQQFVRKITNGAAAYAAAPELDRTYGEHWKAFGLPDQEGFQERVAAWYWEWGYRKNPALVGDLIYDPAPL